MTPTRLAECLGVLHWPVQRLAAILGRQRSTVRQWLAGQVRVPADVAAWIEAAARWHEQHPPPSRDC